MISGDVMIHSMRDSFRINIGLTQDIVPLGGELIELDPFQGY